MESRPLHLKPAIFGLVWSIVVGVAGLFGLRLLQVAASSGGATSFPKETIEFYGAVEVALVVGFFAARSSRLRLKIAFSTVTALVVLISVIAIRPAMGWSADFLPMVLFFEAIWLGPMTIAAVLL